MRSFALWGVLLVALFLPAFLARFGTAREAPVRLDSIPRRDGSVTGTSSVDGGRRVWSEVSIAGGPWHPAGGIVVCRELGYLPDGTPVAYRSEDGTEASGAVRGRPATKTEITMSATLALLAVVLTAAGAAIAVSGASRPALLAGAALSGLGFLSGGPLFEPTVSLVAGPGARNGLAVAWVAFPRHLTFFWLASFLSVFPSDVTGWRISRVSRRLLVLLALAQAVIVTFVHVPGLLESLPVPAQALYVGGIRQNTRILFGIGLLTALALLVVQVGEFRKGTLPAATRRRAEVVGTGLLVGVGPPLVLALVQIFSIVLGGRPLLPSVAMVLSLLPILVVPAVLAYAMLAPRVLTVGILVRKAVLLAFAERTVKLASFAPMAALGLLLYRERQSPLQEILAGHPALVALAVAATVAGLRYGDRTRSLLARLFFRARGATPRSLGLVAEEMRRARDVRDLAELLAQGVERVLGVEQATLFVRSESSGAFACPGRSLPPLEASSTVVEAATQAPGPFRVDPDDGGVTPGLTEVDRHWLTSTRTSLLVPLRGPAGSLLGLLSVGEKLSELPLDPEEEQFLSGAAASGALALENLLLRSSRGSSDGATREPSTAREEPVDEPAGRLCRQCVRVYSADVAGACPEDGTLLEPAPVPALLLGKYRLDRRIGAGGMGVVYKARDLSLSRDVAIKTLPRLSPGNARRLQREARAGARLIHPNLALVFAVESWRGTPMLVLEYLPGGTLSERIRRGIVPPGLAVSWGISLAGALEAAHARGILHRDVKPSNVGFSGDGVPKLLDFGLVRHLDEQDGAPDSRAPTVAGPDEDPPERATLTGSSVVVGTVPYLSPEALQGRTPVAAFDLWSLALTLYECVTGTNPFLGNGNAKSAERVLNLPLPDPRAYRADLPAPLAELLLAALDRDPARRPGSARSLREKLEAVARGLAAEPRDPA